MFVCTWTASSVISAGLIPARAGYAILVSQPPGAFCRLGVNEHEDHT